MQQVTRILLLLIITIAYTGCGNGDERDTAPARDEAPELTEFELEHGIGPVTERLDIGELDVERARRGAEIFDLRCTACHRMGRRFVGPPLGEITEARSPEFLINFILNPEEMTNRHPVGQALLQEYMTIMPYQNVSKEQAIDIVDFLRYYAETGEDLRD
jgi:cytochrome c1